MVYFLSSLFPDHPKIVALFNEDIFKCAVSEIIIPPNNNSDVFPLVQKLREQLERSSTDLLSFFEVLKDLNQSFAVFINLLPLKYFEVFVIFFASAAF